MNKSSVLRDLRMGCDLLNGAIEHVDDEEFEEAWGCVDEAISYLSRAEIYLSKIFEEES